MSKGLTIGEEIEKGLLPLGQIESRLKYNIDKDLNDYFNGKSLQEISEGTMKYELAVTKGLKCVYLEVLVSKETIGTKRPFTEKFRFVSDVYAQEREEVEADTTRVIAKAINQIVVMDTLSLAMANNMKDLYHLQVEVAQPELAIVGYRGALNTAM
jgi:hypothetical protein